MEGIDFIYSVSTPFYLGDMIKTLQEADKVVDLPETEVEQQRELNYMKIRSYVELGHLDKLKKFMEALVITSKATEQELFDICSQLILFLAQKVGALDLKLLQKLNKAFIQTALELAKMKGLLKMTRNAKYRILVAGIICLQTQDYDTLFELLHPPCDQHEL